MESRADRILRTILERLVESDALDVTVGEYRVTMERGRLVAYRNGHLWRSRDLVGDNLMLVFAQRVAELERMLKEKEKLCG